MDEDDDCKDEVSLKELSRIVKKGSHLGNLYFTFFSAQKLVRLFLFKEVEPSPGRKMIKRPIFDKLFPPFTTFWLKAVVE